jgi:hypothetical protein
MPKDVWKGKTAEQIFALGGKGPAAKKAYEAGEPDAPWSKDISSQLRKSARKSDTGQQTKQFQDWTQGASGFTDIYRKGKAGEIKGPEYDLDQKGWDVDIKGYPDDWTQKAGTQDGQSGQYITTDKGQTYFKPTDTGGGGGDEDNSVINTATGVAELAQVDFAELSDDMMLSNRIKSMLNTNNPMFKAASTKALQAMARRGIVNSSMAQESVMSAVMGVAMPIAQAEIAALEKQLYYNKDLTREQTNMMNKYFYEKMLTEIKGATDRKLQELIGQQSWEEKQRSEASTRWSKYGDWMQNILTKEGMEADDVTRITKTMGDWPDL